MTQIGWFYVAEGRRQGPVDLSRVVELIHSGAIPEDAPVWHAGRVDWVPAKRIPEIARELPPPLPGTAPAAGSGPPGSVAFEIPGADGTSAAVSPGLGDHHHEGHHRHRHKRRRYIVITSPWWRRWLVPFLIALVGLVVVVWLYLTHINSQPPPDIYTQPVGAVTSACPATA